LNGTKEAPGSGFDLSRGREIANHEAGQSLVLAAATGGALPPLALTSPGIRQAGCATEILVHKEWRDKWGFLHRSPGGTRQRVARA
jgi:hypothetical protein